MILFWTGTTRPKSMQLLQLCGRVCATGARHVVDPLDTFGRHPSRGETRCRSPAQGTKFGFLLASKPHTPSQPCGLVHLAPRKVRGPKRFNKWKVLQCLKLSLSVG